MKLYNDLAATIKKSAGQLFCSVRYGRAILAAFNYIAGLDAMPMVVMGKALGGQESTVARYATLATTFRGLFHSRYYNATTGTYGRDPLEVQSLTTAPLAMGSTIPDALYSKVVSGLVANVVAQGNHQTVGSVGAKYLLPQLARAGAQKTAMQVGGHGPFIAQRGKHRLCVLDRRYAGDMHRR